MPSANDKRLWSASGPGFSSATDDWATPPHVFEALDAAFDFTLDACASAKNAKCDRYFDVDADGLSQRWAPERTWLNPPYGRVIGRWLEKAARESRYCLIVCLVPARTDTRWWHEWVMPHASEIALVRGRLKFGAGTASAPFPSAVVVYGPSRGRPLFRGWDPAEPFRPDDLTWSPENSMKSSRRPSVVACRRSNSIKAGSAR